MCFKICTFVHLYGNVKKWLQALHIRNTNIRKLKAKKIVHLKSELKSYGSLIVLWQKLNSNFIYVLEIIYKYSVKF